MAFDKFQCYAKIIENWPLKNIYNEQYNKYIQTERSGSSVTFHGKYTESWNGLCDWSVLYSLTYITK